MSETRHYRTFAVYKIENPHTRAYIGTVDAQSPAQAVFRLLGGDWGRSDYVAEELEG